MEDKKINQKESLDLISEMIQKTKSETTTKQDYNSFLMYGYAATIVALIVWALVHFTGNLAWSFVWFAMFLPSLWDICTSKRQPQGVVTYFQSMIQNIWVVIWSMFGLTVIAITAIGFAVGKIDFSLMSPLSLIYAGIGTSMTGLVIKEKAFVWLPLVALFAAVYMLLGEAYDNVWNLLMAVSFLISMVIPSHICRSKIK